MLTDKATPAEMAEAWRRLMKSTATKSDDALMEAWVWLTETINARNEALRNEEAA